MDLIEAAKIAKHAGVVLQVIPPTLHIRNPLWKRIISLGYFSYHWEPNRAFPRPGELKVDPNNGAYMGARSEDVRSFVFDLNSAGIDVLVLWPQVWDDCGRALSFREEWHRCSPSASRRLNAASPSPVSEGEAGTAPAPSPDTPKRWGRPAP